MSIAARFFLVAILVIGLGTYQLADIVVSELKPRSREAIEDTLVDAAYLTAAFIAGDSDSKDIDLHSIRAAFSRLTSVELSAQVFDLRKQNIDIRVSVTDESGIVLFDSFRPDNVGRDFSRWRDVLLTLRGEYGARTTRDNPQDADSTVLYVAAPIRRAGQIVGTVTVAKPTRSSNYFIANAKRRLVREGTITILAMLAVAGLLSALVSRPIRRLTAYARSVRDGKPAELPALGRGEVGELGRAFEEMREALEGKKSIETYVQTLTHELKSPLAAIRGAAELLQEKIPEEKRLQFLGNILGESARIQNLIERLLELASLEARRELDQPERCSLLEISEKAVESLQPTLQRKGVSVCWRERGTAEVWGDAFLIRQALQNVLDNAVEYAPENSIVTLSVTEATSESRVSIEDCGGGIPAYALPKVTERFFSLPRASTGKKSSGLGLSFVAEVAKLHRGRVEISNRECGTGAVVTLILPARR